MDVAREQGLKEIDGLVLVNNPGMLKLMKALGFSIQAYPEPRTPTSNSSRTRFERRG